MLRIGEIAARAGVSRDTVRHYERLGVIARPVRTEAGYRQYPADAVDRIQFVRNALRFGFTLKQIGRFLHACDSGRAPCREVRDAAARIASEMDRQIEEMIAARAVIRKTLADWERRLLAAPPGSRARLLDTIPSVASRRAPFVAS